MSDREVLDDILLWLREKKIALQALDGAASRNDDLGYPIFVSRDAREELASF